MRPSNFGAALILPLLMSVTINVLSLEPNGTATYSELGSELYIGTLFLDTPNQSASEILAGSQHKRMELRFVDTVSKRRWSRGWTQSMAINCTREDMANAAADLSDALSAFKSSLEPGDQVIIDYDPSSGTSVYANDVPLIIDRSGDLFNLFLSAWIGSVPPDSRFKSAILGETDSRDEYAAFLAIAPSKERIDLLENWSMKSEEADEPTVQDAIEEPAGVAKPKVPPIFDRGDQTQITLAKPQIGDKASEPRKEAVEQEVVEASSEKASASTGKLTDEEKQLPLILAEKRVDQLSAASETDAGEAEAEERENSAPQRTEEPEIARVEGEVEEVEVEEEADISAEAILAQQDYSTEVIRKIYSSVTYPTSAIKKNHEGSVKAVITIDRSGSILHVTLLEESEFSSLNRAAVKAIDKAGPFPSFPPSVKEQTLDMMVPIAFKLN